MSFAKQPFSQRFAVMGDMAETAFEEWAVNNDVIFERYGLNRPKFKSFYRLPEFIRITPDYIAEETHKAGTKKYLVECKGTGGRVLKIKFGYLEALDAWHNYLNLKFFVHDSNNHEDYMVPFNDLVALAVDAPKGRFEADDKEFHGIPMDKIKGVEEWRRTTHNETL